LGSILTLLLTEQPTTLSPPIQQQSSIPDYIPLPITEVPAALTGPKTVYLPVIPTNLLYSGIQFATPATSIYIPSSPCIGDITYYQTGLGACRVNSNSNIEIVVALPVGLIGSQSNNNPYCSKIVKIINSNSSITTTVVDKYIGCKDYTINLSTRAFFGLGVDLAVGRKVISWYFID
jgi:hypothetical protein